MVPALVMSDDEFTNNGVNVILFCCNLEQNNINISEPVVDIIIDAYVLRFLEICCTDCHVFKL